MATLPEHIPFASHEPFEGAIRSEYFGWVNPQHPLFLSITGQLALTPETFELYCQDRDVKKGEDIRSALITTNDPSDGNVGFVLAVALQTTAHGYPSLNNRPMIPGEPILGPSSYWTRKKLSQAIVGAFSSDLDPTLAEEERQVVLTSRLNLSLLTGQESHASVPLPGLGLFYNPLKGSRIRTTSTFLPEFEDVADRVLSDLPDNIEDNAPEGLGVNNVQELVLARRLLGAWHVPRAQNLRYLTLLYRTLFGTLKFKNSNYLCDIGLGDDQVANLATTIGFPFDQNQNPNCQDLIDYINTLGGVPRGEVEPPYEEVITQQLPPPQATIQPPPQAKPRHPSYQISKELRQFFLDEGLTPQYIEQALRSSRFYQVYETVAKNRAAKDIQVSGFSVGTIENTKMETLLFSREYANTRKYIFNFLNSQKIDPAQMTTATNDDILQWIVQSYNGQYTPEQILASVNYKPLPIIPDRDQHVKTIEVPRVEVMVQQHQLLVQPSVEDQFNDFIATTNDDNLYNWLGQYAPGGLEAVNGYLNQYGYTRDVMVDLARQVTFPEQ